MSEINTIKTTSQLGLSINRKTNTNSDTDGDKAQGIQGKEPTFDKLSLTNTAAQLQSLQQNLADAPIVDNARVSALKAAIAEGNYTVEPTKLANNMINFEQQLS